PPHPHPALLRRGIAAGPDLVLLAPPRPARASDSFALDRVAVHLLQPDRHQDGKLRDAGRARDGAGGRRRGGGAVAHAPAAARPGRGRAGGAAGPLLRGALEAPARVPRRARAGGGVAGAPERSGPSHRIDVLRGERPVKNAAALVLVLSAALLASPWRGHIDDLDAQLYQCISRDMAARHAWLEPGYPPGSPSLYREHLPFGLWPYVAAVRVAGEGALRPVGALFSLLTVALVISMGWRLRSPGAGVAAGLVLAVTETFFLYGGRPRLDPPLIFFATAAAWAALQEKPRWLVAAALAAIAALIKGPFGLAPLAA